MIIVPIAALPNQTFDILLDNNDWEFALYTLNEFNLMAVDVSLNGTLILSGQRVNSSQFIVPYDYLAPNDGNFFFVTINDEYPDYTKFNLSQQLLYVTVAEFEELRAANF
jgi:hypothetical protein